MYFCADMRSILYYKGFLVVFLLIFFQPSMNFGVLASALAKSVEEQQPNEPTDKIKFDSYKFDFGDIAEDGGEVEHKFTFTNLTGKPVVILDVATGCGCTTPNFSRKPVLHGQQGEIVIVFDPMTRPGRFTKGVMVYTSVSTNGISLTIEGNVLPRKKTLEEEYPFDLGGGVRITSNFHSFAYISRGEKIQQSIGWVNTSTKDATFKAVAKEQSGLLTIDAPAVMKAGQRGEFVISYFVPEGSKRYGTMNDIFSLIISGKEARPLLSAQVIAVDKFDANQEDMSAPIAELLKKIIKFGDVKHGSKVVDASLTLANNGERDLIIRAVEWQSKALECSLKAGDIVKAGQKVTLKFTLDSSQCDYDLWVDRVRIITNDVQHPMQSIRLTGVVVE